MTIMGPRIDEPAQARADGNGTATATITNHSPGQTWSVEQITVSSDSAALSTATVYRNSVTPGNLLVSAYLSGNNDSSTGDSILMQSGESIIVQWTGATASALCTARITASVQTR